MSDYVAGAAITGGGPLAMWVMERQSPSYVGKGGFASIMRLSFITSLAGGFLMLYKRSQSKYIIIMYCERLREQSADYFRMIDRFLWLQRKSSRNRNGHARNGG